MNEIERLNKSNKIIIELNKEINKYNKCLDEIEKIANANYGTILEFYEANKKILQKIKEVKNG